MAELTDVQRKQLADTIDGAIATVHDNPQAGGTIEYALNYYLTALFKAWLDECPPGWTEREEFCGVAGERRTVVPLPPVALDPYRRWGWTIQRRTVRESPWEDA